MQSCYTHLAARASHLDSLRNSYCSYCHYRQPSPQQPNHPSPYTRFRSNLAFPATCGRNFDPTPYTCVVASLARSAGPWAGGLRPELAHGPRRLLYATAVVCGAKCDGCSRHAAHATRARADGRRRGRNGARAITRVCVTHYAEQRNAALCCRVTLRRKACVSMRDIVGVGVDARARRMRRGIISRGLRVRKSRGKNACAHIGRPDVMSKEKSRQARTGRAS